MPDKIRYYSGGVKELIAADCIIFGFDNDELKLLIFKRIVEPSMGEWSLIGSFIKQDESLKDAAKRILYELTGLDNVYMSQLYAHGDVNRDPGARVISVSYYALINTQEHNKNLVKKFGARWVSISTLPKLVFDHNEMVEAALNRLRKEARYKPLGFELLPTKFTLPKLHSLYEAIYQKKIDKRNFRKSILKTGVLDKLDEKEKESSKKGAFYYSFNEKNYKKLTEMGFYFNVTV
ncbi:MAG: NUDIX domain-containing protein [Tenuifilaceae bacterium]